MINTTRKIREAYYQALNGNITLEGAAVPIVDGFSNAENMPKAHIIIGEVTENESGSTMQSWVHEVTVLLDIVAFTPNGYTKDDVDSMEDQVLQILFPTINTYGITVTGFQVRDMMKESSSYLEEEGESGNIVRKLVRITQTVIQS